MQKSLPITARAVKLVLIGKVVVIKKVTVNSSPILSTLHYGKTQYLSLDCGAETSLITARKAKELNLKVTPTNFKALQIDGVSGLKILGECHTSFIRGKYEMFFSGLVVNRMGAGIDILAGCNFLKVNDVMPRLATSEIIIRGITTVPSTSPTVFAIENMDRKHDLAVVTRKLSIAPRDTITVDLPSSLRDERQVFIEPNESQVPAFFNSSLVNVRNGKIDIESKSFDVIDIKKNSQIARVRKVVIHEDALSPPPSIDTPPPGISTPTMEEIISKSNFMDKFVSFLLANSCPVWPEICLLADLLAGRQICQRGQIRLLDIFYKEKGLF